MCQAVFAHHGLYAVGKLLRGFRYGIVMASLSHYTRTREHKSTCLKRFSSSFGVRDLMNQSNRKFHERRTCAQNRVRRCEWDMVAAEHLALRFSIVGQKRHRTGAIALVRPSCLHTACTPHTHPPSLPVARSHLRCACASAGDTSYLSSSQRP